jgi:hypothetical protein
VVAVYENQLDGANQAGLLQRDLGIDYHYQQMARRKGKPILQLETFMPTNRPSGGSTAENSGYLAALFA